MANASLAGLVVDGNHQIHWFSIDSHCDRESRVVERLLLPDLTGQMTSYGERMRAPAPSPFDP